MYACPQGLSPRTLIGLAKSGLKKSGVKTEKPVGTESVNSEREYRLVPMKRLIERLNLTKYNIPAPLVEDFEVKPDECGILLSQHIGKPSVSSVKVGQRVKAGELIADYDDSALSIPLHSSADGTVTAVTDTAITIKAE